MTHCHVCESDSQTVYRWSECGADLVREDRHRRRWSVSQAAIAPHESHGRWKWAEWGRGPCTALSKVMLGSPFEDYLELTIDVDGEPWHLQVSYSKSGVAPAESDPIDAPRVYE